MSTASSPYKPGLEGVVAAQTAISSVDGEKGKLVIRGFAVEDFAPHTTFEDRTGDPRASVLAAAGAPERGA
jgi:citrate synthase